MSAKSALALSLLALVVACGAPSLPEQEKAARAALSSGDYDEALTLCEAGLERAKTDGDAAKEWSFASMRIEALAGTGRGDDVAAALPGMEADYPERTDDPQFYAKLSNTLSKTGQIPAAIEVVEAGRQRFPEKAEIFEKEGKRLGELAKASGDDAALAQLKALGYL